MYDYYPFIRGRQYDLLALQALLPAQPKHIIPLLEPVKDSSTLVKTIGLWLKQDLPIGWLLNPSVGDYALIGQKKHPLPKKYLTDPNFWLFAHFDPSFSALTVAPQGLVCQHYHYLKSHWSQLVRLKPRCILIPDEARFRALFQNTTYPLVHLSDPFRTETKLSAYATACDENFTWQHYLGQLSKNQIGFSDYSLMGRPYTTYGNPQTQQVLHVIYPAENGALRIHHFLSFDDGKMGQQKAKTLDLLQQLRHFVAQRPDRQWYTPALKQLLYNYEIQKNPGFGTIKKLLLAHHFQLVDRLLTRL